MNNILIILIVSAILIAGCVPLVIMYFKERKARLKSEKALAVVIEMGQIDDQIFRIRLDQSESWPASSRAKMLIDNNCDWLPKLC